MLVRTPGILGSIWGQAFVDLLFEDVGSRVYPAPTATAPQEVRLPFRVSLSKNFTLASTGISSNANFSATATPTPRFTGLRRRGRCPMSSHHKGTLRIRR